MSSNGLAVVGSNPAPLAQTGGLGIDFGSKLFQLKPATLSINQPSTQAEGAIKGKLRIAETGDQFDQLVVTLLLMPQERRQYYVGEPGKLNRTQENLMCFSNDLVRPDEKAKVPQALRCAACAKASWDKWRQDKRKENIPPCESFYYALLIDTKYRMPLQMYIRSTGKAPFEQGMKNLARKLYMMQQEGLNPNIFDISFTLSTEKVTKNGTVSWIPKLSGFNLISAEQREEFGSVYKQFVNRKNAPTAGEEEQAAAQIDEAEATINNAVTGEGPAPVLDGEYTGEIAI